MNVYVASRLICPVGILGMVAPLRLVKNRYHCQWFNATYAPRTAGSVGGDAVQCVHQLQSSRPRLGDLAAPGAGTLQRTEAAVGPPGVVGANRQSTSAGLPRPR